MAVEVCGSRGEAASDPSLGNRYTWVHGASRLEGLDWLVDDSAQKTSAWATIATSAPDQLRQRVAWSLAQILVGTKPKQPQNK